MSEIHLNKLPELVKLLEDTYDHVEDIDAFFEKVLLLALDFTNEADYASLILIFPDKKVLNWLAAVGHDVKKLTKTAHFLKNLDIKELERINGNIIEGNVIYKMKNYFSEYEYNLLLKSLKPIKESIVYTLKLQDKNYLIFSLDISEKSEKVFSDKSKEVIKIFANIAYIFIKFKIKNEEIKEYIKNANIEREKIIKLKEEFFSRIKNFKNVLLNLIILFLNNGRKIMYSDEILRYIVFNVPFIEKALIIEMKKDKFKIINYVGYENSIIREISIKDMYRKDGINFIKFNEISGEYFELTTIDENTCILLKLKEEKDMTLVNLQLEVLSEFISNLSKL
ncbi:hypothetical protein [Marinitoga sp. 38H-ov]|uniref:hypothetical protein n=1 Tax=Marinitoga sp. 38H-ov TaxID=1755814 RepID=UPI0013ED5FB4|nr:hypothetical protein [Marinitoga sp. 38H-ov]KAF2955183.1 hypothetical protein AS160_01400 [Marinitoga sp. 38H-ov]